VLAGCPGEGARNGPTPVLMIVLSIRAVGAALVLQRSPLYSEAHQCLGGSLQVATGSGERPQSWEAGHLHGSERGRSGLLPYVARHAPLGSLASCLPVTVRSGPGMK
jgi:hypothetical protein